jgi:hypothetical protein
MFILIRREKDVDVSNGVQLSKWKIHNITLHDQWCA